MDLCLNLKRKRNDLFTWEDRNFPYFFSIEKWLLIVPLIDWRKIDEMKNETCAEHNKIISLFFLLRRRLSSYSNMISSPSSFFFSRSTIFTLNMIHLSKHFDRISIYKFNTQENNTQIITVQHLLWIAFESEIHLYSEFVSLELFRNSIIQIFHFPTKNYFLL